MIPNILVVRIELAIAWNKLRLYLHETYEVPNKDRTKCISKLQDLW